MPTQDNLAKTLHIWHADLTTHANQVTLYWTWLSELEKTRAQRLLALPRQSFIIGRGLLRQQLANYLNQSPESIILTTTAQGKPLLAHTVPLTFNLSHSKNKIAFIFAFNRKVGIDIEYQSPRKWLDKIAYRFLSHTDYQLLQKKTGQEKLHFFFDRWVENEAVIKAWGRPLLSHTHSQYQLDRNTSRSLELMELKEKLTISPFFLDTHFSAAVAIEGRDLCAPSLIIRKIP